MAGRGGAVQPSARSKSIRWIEVPGPPSGGDGVDMSYKAALTTVTRQNIDALHTTIPIQGEQFFSVCAQCAHILLI